jgi:hypothetical protein
MIPSAGPLTDRCNVIEECYEFMLAYAAQGVSGTDSGGLGGQIRTFLDRAAKALAGLADAYSSVVAESGLAPVEPYRAFLSVLDRDAKDSLAAVELVQAQPVISSQLIDNLNASVHLRALLTDLFLIDEIFKQRGPP